MQRFPDEFLDINVLNSIAQFCKSVLAPEAAATDQQARFATHHMKALSDMGIMGMNIPASCASAKGLRRYSATSSRAHFWVTRKS